LVQEASGTIIVLNYNNGSILAQLPLQYQEDAMLSVYNDKVLVSDDCGTRARLMSTNS